MHVRLFAAAQHLERVAPDALHGGNVHPLAAGVDLRQIRAEGHAVEPWQLSGKQSALDAGMDGFHLRVAAVLFAEDRDHALAQRRVLAVFPRGVVARDGHRAAELRHQAAQACDEHLLLRGHAAAHAERRLHGVRIRRQDAEIQRRLHETRNVPAHGLNAVRQAAEHAHGALRGRLVHRRLLRLGCVNAHGHIRVGGRVFVPERGVHVRDRRLRGGCIGHGDDGPALARDGVILQAAGDGDVMSDMVSTAFGSLAMMTSVLVSPDGKYEYEAAHGTVTRHYYKYLKGEETSTNPMATIFAWSGALRKRGEMDNLPELVRYADALEAACFDTLNEGIVTKDLAGLMEGVTPQTKNSAGFIAAIRERLEKKLA